MFKVSILHIGLPMDHSSIQANIRPKVEKHFQQTATRMRELGADYKLIYYSPETGLEGFANQLKSEPCDGVVIGGGVTSNPEMT
ncbi:MAG: hypothetical protein JO001_26305 [Alphaproteobacteria bacterium]|nr:hypothetical protein [Alphaproteobacteria bacterium]